MTDKREPPLAIRISPELRAWLKQQALPGESAAQTAHRLLIVLMEQSPGPRIPIGY